LVTLSQSPNFTDIDANVLDGGVMDPGPGSLVPLEFIGVAPELAPNERVVESKRASSHLIPLMLVSGASPS